MDDPRVSVVMPVYNREKYLPAAVESILRQSIRRLELIIIDDASTDGTPRLLAEYARRDSRISLLRNDVNRGPAATANRGLAVARAPLIAPMDSGDISEPQRLEREVAFLDAHPDHMLVATSYRMINGNGRTLRTKIKPADDFCVRWLMRFRMCMEHPSSCFRATFPDGKPVRYDETFAIGQDFELFERLVAAGKAAILPEVLFNYRMHPHNISSTRYREHMEFNRRVARRVQAVSLPAHLVDRLDALLRCYLLGEPASTSVVKSIISTMRDIIAHDLVANPEATNWLERQAAGIVAEALLGKTAGWQRPEIVAAFLWYGRRCLWPLLARWLEDRQLLPARWVSYPDPLHGWTAVSPCGNSAGS